MKKILLTFFALSFVLTSCEFDKGFEEMNVNPAKANQIYEVLKKEIIKLI